MEKNVPSYVSEFKEFIEKDYYYVDKTKAIEELLAKGEEAILFTRPMWFGKSMFLSMLDNFFDINKKKENKKLFDNLYISKSEYFKHFGKYPVIHFSFSGLDMDSYELCYDLFVEKIKKLYRDKEYITKILDNIELEEFNHIKYGDADVVDYTNSIKNLSKWLERYHKEKVIILIDEYDTPLESGEKGDFYKDILYLVGRTLSYSLSDNSSLKMGIMAGVSKAISDINGLDNFKINTVLSNEYGDVFGFTESETKEIFKYYKIKLTKEVKEYYGKYNIGGVSIYNIYDIANYISTKRLEPYWYYISGNISLRKLIKRTIDDYICDFKKLIKGESLPINYKKLITFIDFEDYYGLDSALYSMITRGYLTLDKTQNGIDYYKIPNVAIREEINKLMKSILNYERFNEEDYWQMQELNKMVGKISETEQFELTEKKNLIENILDGDVYEAKLKINSKLSKFSFYKTFSEKNYRIYFLMLDGLLGKTQKENQSVISTSGSDSEIILKTTDLKQVAVISIKVASSEQDIVSKLNEEKIKLEERSYYKTSELDKIKDVKVYTFIFYKRKCIIQ